jgi:hypothetical protein
MASLSGERSGSGGPDKGATPTSSGSGTDMSRGYGTAGAGTSGAGVTAQSDPVLARLLGDPAPELQEKLLSKLAHICERIDSPVEAIVLQIRQLGVHRLEVRTT